MLARYPRLENMMSQKLPSSSPWYQFVGRDGTYRNPDSIDGLARIISAHQLDGLPLVVCVTMSEEVQLADWRRQSLLIALGALCSAIALTVFLCVLRFQFVRIQTSGARFQGLATTSSDWFWETDAHHRISYLSEGVSKIGFGIDPTELIGRTRLDIVAPAAGDAEKWRAHYDLLDRHESFRDFTYGWTNTRGRGIASISGDPLFDKKGRFLGYRGSGRDVTSLTATEAQLRQTQEDLNRAQRLAHIGTDVWDLRTGQITWSDGVYRIFGLDPETFTPTSDNFAELIVPQDRPELLARRAAILAGERPSAWEFSIRRPDGEIRRISSEAELVFDDEGRPLRWVAMRHDITEQLRAERSLREAKDAAEAANLAKSQFVANISHELRTPLNAIIGFSEMIEQGLARPTQAKQREYTAAVLQSGRYLLNIINDILDLARADSGKFELYEEAGIAAGEIVDACLTLTRHRAVSRSVMLSAAVDENVPPIVADPTRLKQILLNLISNAIRFTKAGGSVTVSARRGADGRVAFAVSDTGVGMTPDEIETALEPFGQVDARLAREHEGTGLGLPLARRLTELHGGTLHIESKKGRGTTVTITLPAARTVVKDRRPPGRSQRLTRGPKLDQSPCPVGVKSKSSRGTVSKKALCSLCGNGQRTGWGCELVYQLWQLPVHTVPGNAASRRARNFSVAAWVGAAAARRARASPISFMMTPISCSSPKGTGTLFTGANGP